MSPPPPVPASLAYSESPNLLLMTVADESAESNSSTTSLLFLTTVPLIVRFGVDLVTVLSAALVSLTPTLSIGSLSYGSDLEPSACILPTFAVPLTCNVVLLSIATFPTLVMFPTE